MDILAALAQTTDCLSCNTIFIPAAQKVASQGNTVFEQTFTDLCINVAGIDPDVCSGNLALQGPILVHSLLKFTANGTTSHKFCNAVVGLCANNETPITPFTVPLPPQKKIPTLPPPSKTRQKPFQVVHLSDVHIDRDYTIGSEANCTKSLCCEPGSSPNNPPTVPAGPFGNSRCDSPGSLADSMLAAIRDLEPRFSIFTGDVVVRTDWLVNKTIASADLVDFDIELAERLGTFSPIFPAIGNHDTAPVNSFPRSTTQTADNSQWVFDIQSEGWKNFIGIGAANQVRHSSGSYAAIVPGTRLKIISINTQYWYRQNFWLYDSDEQQPDPNGILAFMVQELQSAEDDGLRVWIIGHIPLGKEDVFEDQSNYYDQVLQRYKYTIAGQFFGHSHRDEFEIAYSDYANQTAANAVSFAMIAPALTPTSGNPAFKVYDVDPETYEVMDAKTFFANMTDPSFQQQPFWSLYYSTRDTWGSLISPPLPPSSALAPAFWHNLTELFLANDTALQLYNAHLTRGFDVQFCDANCKNTTVCDLRAFRSQNNCDTPTPGLEFGRRDEGHGLSALGMRESVECEGVSFGYMLRKVHTNVQGSL